MHFENLTTRLVHGDIDLLAGGEGPTLFLLHRDTGRPPWGPLEERLARSFRVVMPSLPGFDGSQRPEWLRNVSDLAAIVGQLIDEFDDSGGIGIVGLGFGGWVAAELAARSPSRVAGLFLHAPMGIKPPTGEILDSVLWETLEYIRLGFASEAAYAKAIADSAAAQRDMWENNREMVMRLSWKPYMHNPALPHLLKGASLPTLVAWNSGDRIVPRSAPIAYVDAIAGARFVEFNQGGHHADVETPDLLAHAIEGHFGAFLRKSVSARTPANSAAPATAILNRE